MFEKTYFTLSKDFNTFQMISSYDEKEFKDFKAKFQEKFV